MAARPWPRHLARETPETREGTRIRSRRRARRRSRVSPAPVDECGRAPDRPSLQPALPGVLEGCGREVPGPRQARGLLRLLLCDCDGDRLRDLAPRHEPTSRPLRRSDGRPRAPAPLPRRVRRSGRGRHLCLPGGIPVRSDRVGQRRRKRHLGSTHQHDPGRSA